MATRTGDRESPGRLAFLDRLQTDVALGIATSVLLILVTRLPLMTRYLLNWDAVQFALGMRHFDIAHHQPHPPGYLGYIALGRLLEGAFPDPNVALVVISIAGEAAAAALAFWFAQRVFGLFAGWVAALALVASPLFWYYGEAANTYALEPLLTLVVGWFCWRMWNRDTAAAWPAALAMGVVGAIRPSTAVLMAPLFLIALWRLREPRVGAGALGLAGLATLAWLVPLVALSGGLRNYLAVGLQLGESVSTGTAIWERGLDGLTVTTDAVARGIGWELGLFALPLAVGLIVVPLFMWRRPAAPPGWWPFCAAWAAPGLATFLLIHIGQVVYVQVFTCVFVLSLGVAVRAMAASMRRRSVAIAAITCACAFNTISFFVPGTYSLQGQLQVHDAYMSELIDFGAAQDPGSTVLLTDASGASSYRLSQFYLPEFHRISIGRDKHGWLGEIYGDTYDLSRYEHATGLRLPVPAREFVLLDREMVHNYVADPERLHIVWMTAGNRVYVWKGAPPRFVRGELWFGSSYRDRRGVA